MNTWENDVFDRLIEMVAEDEHYQEILEQCELLE